MKPILKFEPDCSVLSAWCEICDHEITDAEMAMAYWCHEDYKHGLRAPLLAHKRCMSASSRDEEYACSMELSTYLVFLLQNVGLTGRKLTKAMRNAGLLSNYPVRHC